MDKFDRIQQLHRLLSSHRRPVPLRVIAERLECSERNARRIIETMQNVLDAPIEYNREHNGWHYADSPENRFQLPGLWLTGGELQSLTLLLNVLENFGNGLLNRELSLIEKQIHHLLAARGVDPSAFTERIKVLPLGNRQVPGRVFHAVSEALLNRQQLRIHYKSYDQRASERVLSPQHLIFYRENWYLDAWCHLREDLRTFSIARIAKAEVVKARAKRIDKKQLEGHFAQSYGIFAGKPQHQARLRFYPAIAHEIALQQWHPQQRGEWEGGDYLLTIPYGDSRELVQDIMRHLPYIDVESPAELRSEITARLKEALILYDEPNG
ncbi:MAG: WYL domain-containing transcriptional regulator [Porticoccaceae bacterium]